MSHMEHGNDQSQIWCVSLEHLQVGLKWFKNLYNLKHDQLFFQVELALSPNDTSFRDPGNQGSLHQAFQHDIGKVPVKANITKHAVVWHTYQCLFLPQEIAVRKYNGLAFLDDIPENTDFTVPHGIPLSIWNMQPAYHAVAS